MCAMQEFECGQSDCNTQINLLLHECHINFHMRRYSVKGVACKTNEMAGLYEYVLSELKESTYFWCR